VEKAIHGLFPRSRPVKTPRVSMVDGIASSDACLSGKKPSMGTSVVGGGGIGERLRSASDETFAVHALRRQSHPWPLSASVGGGKRQGFPAPTASHPAMLGTSVVGGGGIGERSRSASDETFAVPQPVMQKIRICDCS
jgi:hypothetical protein